MKTNFASHPKSKYWSSKNEGKPEDYTLNSHKKCWFDCDKCGHKFQSTLLNINKGNNWCGYCYNRKICRNCAYCFNKSFASHSRSVCWSPKNNIELLLIYNHYFYV